MAASTSARVRLLTLGCRFSTRETVWWDTPASLATSCMPGRRRGAGTVSSPSAEGEPGTLVMPPAYRPDAL